ncbi:hypothetical protein Acsp01_43300 [Actinoplanes sp. NBRC 101535]|nr:hypothetical protein Acsp01_43300 [Actinoplanes sp. NBRC 101535]
MFLSYPKSKVKRMKTAIQKARRLTLWSLGSALALGWIGFLSGVMTELADTGGLAPVRFVTGLVGMAGFTWFGYRVARVSVTHWQGATPTFRRDVVLSGAGTLIVLVSQGAGAAGAGFVGACWLSLAAMRARPWPTFLAATATAAVSLLIHETAPFGAPDDHLPPGFAAGLFLTLSLVLPYANQLWVWIFDLAEQAHASKDAETRLAVTEERLRFARDLHDLVGHSLSVIAVKSELAGKLTRIDAARAAGEMTAVRGLAQDSLRQIREAVRGYRVLDLPSEVESVRAILAADGIRCQVDVPAGLVGADTAGTFAWVVRESATNILRHSAATWCRISVHAVGDTAVLEVLNDGAATPDGEPGSGLAGMAERLSAVGGLLTAQPTPDGHFLVRAVAPLGTLTTASDSWASAAIPAQRPPEPSPVTASPVTASPVTASSAAASSVDGSSGALLGAGSSAVSLGVGPSDTGSSVASVGAGPSAVSVEAAACAADENTTDRKAAR